MVIRLVPAIDFSCAASSSFFFCSKNVSMFEFYFSHFNAIINSYLILSKVGKKCHH